MALNRRGQATHMPDGCPLMGARRNGRGSCRPHRLAAVPRFRRPTATAAAGGYAMRVAGPLFAEQVDEHDPQDACTTKDKPLQEKLMNQDKDTAGSTSDTFSKDRMKSEVAAGKGKLAELAESAASAGKAQLDTGLGQAAGQVEGVAKVIDETASRLRSENHEGLAAYASQVAGSIENVANRLRNSSVDELATEARQLARSNPALFLLGSVVVGFGLTRFLKASSRISQDYDDRTGEGQMRRDVYGSSYGDSRDPTHDWDSGTGGRSQGGWDAGSRGSSGAAGSNWDRGGSTGTGASSGAGSTGGSSGLGSSGGLGGTSSTLGGSTSTTGSSTSGSSTSGVAGSGTRSGTDTFDELRSRPVFPEMKTDGLSSGGTVGGTRTNQVSGGSNG